MSCLLSKLALRMALRASEDMTRKFGRNVRFPIAFHHRLVVVLDSIDVHKASRMKKFLAAVRQCGALVLPPHCPFAQKPKNSWKKFPPTFY